jgi:hypothetical protein
LITTFESKYRNLSLSYKMYFLQFKKQYGISLLPEAFNNVTLGDLLFVSSLDKRPTSIITSLPTHIYNLFGYLAVISRKSGKRELAALKMKLYWRRLY